ncbi:hypothetical protein ACKWTF_015520 [Chironomus riparius]
MKMLLINLKIVTVLLNFQQLSNSQRPLQPNEKNVNYISKFRAVNCNSLHNSTAYWTLCYIKSYSRTISTLNFGIKAENPIKPFLQFVASYRYGNIYREVMDTKIFDWCVIMDGLDSNILVKFILDTIRESIPGLFHKCPYYGLMEFYNITINDEVAKKLSIFPEGQYKYNVTIFDRPDRVILVIAVFVDVKSPSKSSFG